MAIVSRMANCYVRGNTIKYICVPDGCSPWWRRRICERPAARKQGVAGADGAEETAGGGTADMGADGGDAADATVDAVDAAAAAVARGRTRRNNPT